jgi:alpha-1,3-rhamnosyl/mannosyltransferase
MRALRLKIVYNSISLLTRASGIGNYVYSLAKTLNTFSGLEFLYFYGKNFSTKLENKNSYKISEISNFIRDFIPFSYEIRDYIVKFNFKRSNALEGKFDIYHETANLLLPCNEKSVLTVHDLSWIKYPELHPKKRVKLMNKFFEAGLKNADQIITPLSVVKSDLINNFGIDGNKITAIPLGINQYFKPIKRIDSLAVLNKFGLSYKQYFIFLGTLEPRKNLATLLHAYSRLSKSTMNRFPLVIVGGMGWGAQMHDFRVEKLINLGVVRFVGYLADDELSIITGASFSMVFPSFYEGFGLPPLEAMACGVPVIASDISSSRETMKDAAIFVDPIDVDGFTSAFNRLINDKKYYNELVQLSISCSAKYSWLNCAISTLNVYKKALL